MRLRAPLVLVLVVVLALGFMTSFVACDGTEADEGRDAALHVADAVFIRGPMPPENGGPQVTSLTIGPSYEAGSAENGIIGDTSPSATAIAIGLAGDRGYWIVRAGVPSAIATSSPTFETVISFSAKMAPGPRELIARAVDGDRRFGPATTRAFTITERGVPRGELVVSLTWSNHANLDLHVVDPTGAEVFRRDVNSFIEPPPGSSRLPPNAPRDGGILDFDSHAECVRDGLRTENVVYTETPPKGRYLVRVDTFSLCGEPGSRWRVQALLRGVRIASAEGASTEIDTTFSHNRGAGVLALEFDVP